VSRGWLLASIAMLACTDRGVDSGARLLRADSSSPATAAPSASGDTELIPAEWTLFEDTSRTGEVTTASLQLPAAKDIEGLLDEKEPPRLILRCVGGKVAASIETEASDTLEPVSVPIQLDSAPPCE
jgi:hypothetical protein